MVNIVLVWTFPIGVDIIEHEILLTKLGHYVAQGIALAWIASFMSNR